MNKKQKRKSVENSLFNKGALKNEAAILIRVKIFKEEYP